MMDGSARAHAAACAHRERLDTWKAAVHEQKHLSKTYAKQQRPLAPPPPPPPPLLPGGVVPAQYVDLLLLIRSRYFLGNPASTFAANVARVRASELGDPFANLRRCPQYP